MGWVKGDTAQRGQKVLVKLPLGVQEIITSTLKDSASGMWQIKFSLGNNKSNSIQKIDKIYTTAKLHNK